MPRAGLDRAGVTALALAVVDEGEELTLAAVAQRAGVAVPSLYKHVAGLPALRRDVARRCLDELGDAMHAALAGAHGPEAVRRLAHALRDWARAHPGRWAATQAGWSGRDAELEQAAARAVGLAFEAVAEAGVPEAARVDAVRATRAAVHGFVGLELAGGFGMPDDVDASFGYLVDRLVAALAGSAPSS